MFKSMFKNKWMYPWVAYTAIAVYGGVSIFVGVVSLLCIWAILDEVHV